MPSLMPGTDYQTLNTQTSVMPGTDHQTLNNPYLSHAWN